MSFDDPMAASNSTNEKAKSENKGSGQRTCKEEKYELVEFDSLPDYLKDNEFVVGYYRCEWPMKQTIQSIFSVHNETLNVWTHLIGFFVFLSLTICTAMMIPRDASVYSVQQSIDPAGGTGMHVAQRGATACHLPSKLEHVLETTSLPTTEMLPPLSSWNLHEILLSCLPKRFSHVLNHTNPCLLANVKDDVANMISPLLREPITRWPFLAFLCGAMLCLLTSSICHLVSCHSERTSYIMLRLDYAGIATLIVTSFFPTVYYPFMCNPFYCNLYIGFITTFGVAAVLASLVPVFQTAEFRPVRAVLFFCMGVSGVVPIVHKLLMFGDRPEAVASAWYELLMGTFYGIGVAVYAARVPERWMPGKFDLLGHSHQLFHLLVIAGAYAHYLAGLQYLKWRDIQGC